MGIDRQNLESLFNEKIETLSKKLKDKKKDANFKSKIQEYLNEAE